MTEPGNLPPTEESDGESNVVPIENARVDKNHWTYKLACHRKGKVWEAIPTEMNVMHALKGSTTFVGLFRYNERSVITEIVRRPPWDAKGRGTYPRPIEDHDLGGLRSMLCVQVDASEPKSTGLGIMVGSEVVRNALEGLCKLELNYDPVVSYLGSLKWDGVARLDTFLERHFLAEKKEVARVMWRRWMVSAVKRAREPGCQADHMLILTGEQGSGKSRMLRELFTLEWHVDGFPNVESDYAPMQLEGQWCVEAGELSRFNGAISQESLKQFLTRTVDKYKKPYGVFLTINKRRCVFVGTSNADTFLSDPTGGRRFWPVHLRRVVRPSEAEWEAIRAERDQLWAEAVALYEAGEPIYMREEALETDAKFEQLSRQNDDPMTSKLEKVLHRETMLLPGLIKEVQLYQVLDWIGIPSTQYGATERKVAKSMRALGWKLVRPLRNGKRVSVWQKATEVYMPTEEECSI